MPIYAGRCDACGWLTSQLALHTTVDTLLACKVCANLQTYRVMKRFACHRSEANRLVAFDTSVPHSPDYYKDSRHVGLRAKKRGQP